MWGSVEPWEPRGQSWSVTWLHVTAQSEPPVKFLLCRFHQRFECDASKIRRCDFSHWCKFGNARRPAAALLPSAGSSTWMYVAASPRVAFRCCWCFRLVHVAVLFLLRDRCLLFALSPIFHLPSDPHRPPRPAPPQFGSRFVSECHLLNSPRLSDGESLNSFMSSSVCEHIGLTWTSKHLFIFTSFSGNFYSRKSDFISDCYTVKHCNM